MPLRGGPVPPRGGPSAAERRPLCREEALCAAERRPLCRREEAPVPGGGFCAGSSSVLRGLEEAPVSEGGPCAERRPSMLVGTVLCAERIEGGPCVGRRLTVPNGPTPLC